MSKIVFIGNFQYNCGSSNTVLGYIKAGEHLGHEVRVSEYGYIDEVMRQTVPIAPREWKADIYVIVYESYPFLTQEAIRSLIDTVPVSKRLLLDPDGKYLPPIKADYDSNHENSSSYEFWKDLYDSLSQKILQPRLIPSDNPKIIPFLYFGVDNNKTDNLEHIEKEYDLMYLGNNWYRWEDIVKLTETVEPIRNKIKKFALIGQYWDESTMKNFERATRSDVGFLSSHNVQIRKSAGFGKVESTMSSGKLNPILVRPILNKLGFVTPRMFETFFANTVPLIPDYFTHADALYGSGINQLKFSFSSPVDISNIYDSYEKNLVFSHEIKSFLEAEHSYKKRIKQLIDIV